MKDLFIEHMENLKERHEICVNTINLIIECKKTITEMRWSNDRNAEQGLKLYHSEQDIINETNALEKLQERYFLLTSKL